MMMMMTTMT